MDAAEGFEDLPFVWAIGGAVIALLLFELVIPAIAAAIGQSKTTTINYGLLFAPMVRFLGLFLAAAIVAFGVKGAAARFFENWRARATFERAVGRPGALSMTWTELEVLIGQTYRRLGYEVVRRGGHQADGGVDLELRRSGERVLVQCKHWKSWKVGVKPVRELWGVVSSEGATRAVFITTGTYTQAAKDFARDKALELLAGPEVVGLIKGANSVSEAVEDGLTSGDAAPRCRRCGNPMIRRTARSGPNAGHDFWGCSMFPKCSGTEAIPPETS